MPIDYYTMDKSNYQELYFEFFQNFGKYKDGICPTLRDIKYFCPPDVHGHEMCALFFAVGKDTGHVVACLEVNDCEGAERLSIIYCSVIPSHRNRGIARELFKRMEAYLGEGFNYAEMQSSGFTEEGREFLRPMMNRLGIITEDIIKFY